MSGWVVAAVLTAGAGLLSGCATPTPGAIINYRQIGVCDGTFGAQAGSNAAFVLYQLDTIANQSSAPFAFDPAKFSANAPQAASTPLTFITASPVLGALGAGPAKAAPVGAGQVLGLPPSAYGVATVGTGPASQANGTQYFLIYATTVNDPPVIPVLIDLARKAWPTTSNCADISTNLGQFAYVDGGGTVSTLRIDPATGVLTDLHKPVADTYVAGDHNHGTFVADPRGHFLFAIDTTSGKLLTFKINPSDGSLSPPTESAPVPSPYPHVPADPSGLAIDPAGRFVFVSTISFGVDVYSVDATTGTLTYASNTPMSGGSIESVVADGSGRFLYVLATNLGADGLTAYAINPSSGALSPIGTVQASLQGGLNSITISPLNGYLYFNDAINRVVRVFAFSPTTFAFTQPVGPTPMPNGAFSLTFDGSGGYLYVVTGGAGGPLAYSVSSTGALQPSASPSSQNPTGIFGEPTGRFIYFQDTLHLTVTGYTLNPNTGALAQMPGTPLTVPASSPLTIPGTY
jgi:6-phosphogluconolactonase (cycloisomerase 2 family)